MKVINKNVLTLKTIQIKYIFLSLFAIVILACSTQKDKWINRNFQALNTKYNVLYNGNVALDKGIIDLKSQYKDNFWEILPVERMQTSTENILPGQTKNANFEKAETKATKAIQKRSMNIGGKEKNPQIDEAHLLLGKSRYYDQRFIPALEAFNYILYKYPESDKIYEAQIWREKTNMRLENDGLALINLRKLLKEIKFKDQVFADANATLAQAFLKTEEKDSAVVCLKLATQFTKSNEEKARYRFIVGQIYEELGYKDSAFAAFQSVIDMKHKSPRSYVIQSHAKQVQQFDFKNGDTVVFLKNYGKLLKDRENRPFLDVLNHQMALFYDKNNVNKKAIEFYNKSLRTKSEDQYLMASNYRNLAKRYFDNAKYQTAGQYYDSTLTRLTARTREFNYIKKKRDNLADVIKYEGIAQRNDSILNVVSLSDSDKKSFYDDYIVKLKKADDAKAELEKIEKDLVKNEADNSDNDRITGNDTRSSTADAATKSALQPPTFGPKPTSAQANSFYFYNPSTVAFGKIEFKKKWGNRALKNNWRLSSEQSKGANNNEDSSNNEDVVSEEKEEDKSENPKYNSDFYIKQLPTDQKEIDSLAKERNFAYYQLGIIYKEKFKEYKLASDKLEALLKENPEERLVLPSMYNLYKIYEIINKEKAQIMKDKIIAEYPNSRYAQILSNPNDAENAAAGSPQKTYDQLYELYLNRSYFKVLEQSSAAIDQFTGEEIVPKLELLKATTIGKLKGLAEYKTALNFVALNYPNVEEGKAAESIITNKIPILEKMNFYNKKPASWKIIYPYVTADSLKMVGMANKIKKFTEERTSQKLKFSQDIYNMTDSFVVIHGMISEENAKDIDAILKDYKDYKIEEKAIVISNENYKIVQIKKNLPEYLTTQKSDPIAEPVDVPSVEKPNSNGQNERINTKNNIDARTKNSVPTQSKENELRMEDADDPEPSSDVEKVKSKMPPQMPKRP